MAETARQLRLLRFGDFEVDLRSGELRKAGVKLKFGGQPFQVLSILLEQPGDVVTREELQKRLWPDTFVDVDHNLNTAINKIREVLGDSAESPRFVETLPRRGYRFIGELEPPVQPVVQSCGRTRSRLALASNVVEDRRRRSCHLGRCPCSRGCVSMASAAASAGAGGFDCRSVYGSARTWRPPRLSLPMAPESLSPGMVIQRVGPRVSTCT